MSSDHRVDPDDKDAHLFSFCRVDIVEREGHITTQLTWAYRPPYDGGRARVYGTDDRAFIIEMLRCTLSELTGESRES